MKWTVFFIVMLIILLLNPLLFSYTQSLDDRSVKLVESINYGLTSSNGYVNVNASETKQMIESSPNLIILDVRTLEEYNEGHIEDAVLIPVSELGNRLDELDKEKQILVYCRSGGRSATASQILVDNGFTSVYNMLGGIIAWTNEGYIVYVKYSSIQEAINNAYEGDTIYISSGTYHENVIINNIITLIGENKSNTIIDGGNIGKVVKITVNDTEVRGFTIQKAGFTPWGSDSGIYVKSSNNVITDNIIVDNDDWAIWLDSFSSNNTLTYNEITNNWRGCMLKDTSGNTLVENNITNHGQDGICLWNSSQNVIADNNISNNVDGLALASSHNNNITSNNITNNLHGVSADSSTNNELYHNNFINNNQQVYLFTFVGTNFWDDGYPSGGNYWSEYSEPDYFSGSFQNLTGSDGIGDAQYVIDDDNIDRYPLMVHWVPELLETDLNDDGTVNIVDISIVAIAFGSAPEDPYWNIIADLNNDQVINILDISMVAKDYGKTV